RAVPAGTDGARHSEELGGESVPAGTDAAGDVARESVPAGTRLSPESEGLDDESVPAGTDGARHSGDLEEVNVPAGPAGTPPTVSLPDALVAIANRQLAALEQKVPPADAARTPAAKNRELLLHLRTSDLVKGAFVAELHDGTPLDGATFCRLACDTGVVVAHTDDDGDPLDVGRRRRTIPSALMRALLIRDRGCAFPGCSHQAFVEAHHLEHWSNGGATSKDNLVCVCHTHHVALHEGGFTAERQEDGSFLFRDPRGRPIPAHPEPASPKPTPPIDDPKTNLLAWDGRPMDLHRSVSALVNRQLGCTH
ncbi:MAG: HNH endonuclease signature motif containing protein, partial [Polyangiaceae bacterium]